MCGCRYCRYCRFWIFKFYLLILYIKLRGLDTLYNLRPERLFSNAAQWTGEVNVKDGLIAESGPTKTGIFNFFTMVTVWLKLF